MIYAKKEHFKNSAKWEYTSKQTEFTQSDNSGAFERLAPGADGSIYGLSPERLLSTFQRPSTKTKIKGLYLAGGEFIQDRVCQWQLYQEACGRNDKTGPCFDLNIPPNGYGWWYMDGLSDDGTKAVSVIAFIGSVSPHGIAGLVEKTLMTFVQ